MIPLILARIEMRERRRHGREHLETLARESTAFAREHPWMLAVIVLLACAIDVVVAFGIQW